MTCVVINPGTGDAHSYGRCSERSAVGNMKAFVRDLKVDGATFSARAFKIVDGRWRFRVRHGRRSVIVDMPGVALYRVRYIGRDCQDIWHFPCLYVDWHSLVWKFAVEAAHDHLTGTEMWKMGEP